MSDGSRRVGVAVRVRPVLRGNGGSHTHQLEKFELEAISRISDSQIKVEQKKQDEACRSSIFTFDYIFDQESTQLEVYEESVVDLVDAALVGVNATILAYGQTGSGKTHTVLGEVKPNPLENDLLTHNSGLFLRVLSDLMEYKRRRANDMHVVVGLSCVEIYNENIRDLFGGSPNEQPPQLRAVMIGDDVHLPSLIVKEVTSLQAVFAEIQLAVSRRQSRSTEANATSSRSHCLFMIDILQCPTTAPCPSLTILQQDNSKGGEAKIGRTRGSTVVGAGGTDESVKGRARGATTVGSSPIAPSPQTPVVLGGFDNFLGTIYRVPGQAEPIWGSKILLADLAGSEKIKNSGVVGEGLAEATSINSSLTALGNVVHSLHEGSYVSYRTSNLTRLLKPTFSHPSSRVLLLAQVSPTQLTFDETISTLHFANKVKAMKVTTTTGAESEKLQFEFIEAEKTFDSLLADIHIFAAETLCPTTIPQHRAKLLKDIPLFYDLKAKRSYKRDERKLYLEQTGLISVAEETKQQVKAKALADERNALRELDVLFAKEKDGIVAEYTEQRSDLLASLASLKKDCLDHSAKITTLEYSALSSVLQEEEEVTYLGIMAAHFSQLQRIGRAEVSQMDNELQHLHSFKSKNTAAVVATHCDPAEDESTAEHDAHYALASWAHCNAKRFFCTVMELREAQLRMNLVKTQVAALDTWIRKAESKGK